MNKISIIGDKRVLARTFVYDGGVDKLVLLDLENDQMVVENFDIETANTVFADGIVVCMRSEIGEGECIRLITDVLGMSPSDIMFELASKKSLASAADASADIILVNISD